MSEWPKTTARGDHRDDTAERNGGGKFISIAHGGVADWHSAKEVDASSKKWAQGFENFGHALVFHFCLNLPAAFTQPFVLLLGEPCILFFLSPLCHCVVGKRARATSQSKSSNLNPERPPLRRRQQCRLRRKLQAKRRGPPSRASFSSAAVATASSTFHHRGTASQWYHFFRRPHH